MPKRFALYGHTIGIIPRTQTLELHPEKIVSPKRNTTGVAFVWSHHRIYSKDSEVKITS